MKKVTVLQLGEVNLQNLYPIDPAAEWIFEPGPEKAPEKLYDLALIFRNISPEEAAFLQRYVPAYCVYIPESLTEQVEAPLEQLLFGKVGKVIPSAFLPQFLNREIRYFFPKPYGEKMDPRNLTASDSFAGTVRMDGFQGLFLDGTYGDEFFQAAYWRNNIPIEPEQCLEFWLEYAKDPGVEIELRITEFASGSISEMINVKTFSEADLQKTVFVENGERSGSLFMEILAKGSGKLHINALHDRYARKDFGEFVPGGYRRVSAEREEAFFYFDPADGKPPLNVYFSGYKTKEGFEGMNMMRAMGAPFLLISESRLEGGAFYLGTPEYEKMITDEIRACMKELGFTHDQVILSGLSMGTFGALYYGCEIRPKAVLVGKPLVSLGNIAKNERIKRPGGFPTSLDVLRKYEGASDEKAVEELNQRFWQKFGAVSWEDTKFAAAYMIEDDYDQDAYRMLMTHLDGVGVRLYGKGLHGRHNDDTHGIVSWFISRFYSIMEEDFNRKRSKEE